MVSLIFGYMNELGDEKGYILCDVSETDRESQLAIKHHWDVLPPFVLATKAVIQVNLTTSHMGHGQNPMYLLGSMDWDNPYVLFPISGTLNISPQLSVDGLVAYPGQGVGGEDSASLGEMVA